MKILAIDTGAGTSVAAAEWLQDQFLLRGFAEFSDPFGHAENIGLAISQALSEADWSPEEVQLLAANQGPAGYTGLRVGLAAITAFAAVRKLPKLGVSSLAAAAFAQLRRDQTASKLSVALEAKRGELFFQQFERHPNGGLPVAVTQPKLLPISELPQPLSAEWVTKPADARAIAELAIQQWHERGEVGELVAQYLRAPDVTPSAGKRVSG